MTGKLAAVREAPSDRVEASRQDMGGIDATFGRFTAVLEELGVEYAPERQRLRALQTRLCQGQFHLAVLGQFKRGKSTLLNALVGIPILPTSVLPLTSVPTFLRGGAVPRIAVSDAEGRVIGEISGGQPAEWNGFLAGFVTEEKNPGNRLGAACVDAILSSPILTEGLTLIDTPGIGSTYQRNTAATLNFLPQCDGALFVVSADPPMTAVEVEFLKQVRTRIHRLFFVFNKTDYLDEEERRAAATFFRQVLRDDVGIAEEVPIFMVSARLGLKARLSGDTVLWEESGLSALERHLVEFGAAEKARALHEAVGRKVRDLLQEVLLQLDITRQSLQMPLGDLERRLGALDEELSRAEEQRASVAYLVLADQKRVDQYIESCADQLRNEASRQLEAVVCETVGARSDGRLDEAEVRDALARVIPTLFETKFWECRREVERRIQEAAQRHESRIASLVEQIRHTAADLFEIPYDRHEGMESAAIDLKPHWLARTWSTSFEPIPVSWAIRLLPRPLRRRIVRKRIDRQVDELVVQNVEDMRWTMLRHSDRFFLRFRSAIDEQMDATIAATQGAMERAYVKRREHIAGVAPELARLSSALARLRSIQERLPSS